MPTEGILLLRFFMRALFGPFRPRRRRRSRFTTSYTPAYRPAPRTQPLSQTVAPPLAQPRPQVEIRARTAEIVVFTEREIIGRASVIDGDTIIIKGERIRLAGID